MLELGKNADKEYFRPQGYESLKTKIQHLAKRVTNKDNVTSKPSRESQSKSDDSRSMNSEDESEDDNDMELEDDIEGEDGGQIKNELEASKDKPKLKPQETSKAPKSMKKTIEIIPEESSSSLPTGKASKKTTYGPARPSNQIITSVESLFTSKTSHRGLAR